MARVSLPVRNTLGYAVPELFWGVTWSLSIEGPMVAAFGNDFGGSEGFVGLAWLLAAFALGAFSLLSAYWVAPMRHKRLFVFWGHVAGGVALLGVAVLLRLAPDDRTARIAFLAGTSVFFLTVGLLIPGWLALVGELFGPGQQARVLGISFIANRLAAMFAGQWVARSVLARPWDATDQWSLLFALAGAAGVVGSLPFLWIVERPPRRAPRGTLREYLRGLAGTLRDLPALRRFVTADSLGITVLLTLSFYADAAIRKDGFHNSWSGHWVMVGAVAQLLTSGLIACMGDRLQPRTWMIAGLLAACAASLAAARGASLAAYELAAGGLGVYLACRASCHAPQVLRLAPRREGTGPIGVAVAATMPVQGLVPWIAGMWIIPGGGHRVAFLAVASLGLLAAILLLRWVPRDVGNGVGSPATPASIDPAVPGNREHAGPWARQ